MATRTRAMDEGHVLSEAKNTFKQVRSIRKSGTGGIYQINDHMFEGRYNPTNAQGKREVLTVYAQTREEVEPLLEQMIEEVRERIKNDKNCNN